MVLWIKVDQATNLLHIVKVCNCDIAHTFRLWMIGVGVDSIMLIVAECSRKHWLASTAVIKTYHQTHTNTHIMQLSRATQHLGRSNNMRCCPHYGKAARPPIHRCTRATRVLRACNQPHKTPVAEQQPLHKRMAMWALASVAAAALAAPLPANADGLVQVSIDTNCLPR